jgi:hypothetical protein
MANIVRIVRISAKFQRTLYYSNTEYIRPLYRVNFIFGEDKFPFFIL